MPWSKSVSTNMQSIYIISDLPQQKPMINHSAVHRSWSQIGNRIPKNARYISIRKKANHQKFAWGKRTPEEHDSTRIRGLKHRMTNNSIIQRTTQSDRNHHQEIKSIHSVKWRYRCINFTQSWNPWSNNAKAAKIPKNTRKLELERIPLLWNFQVF